MNIPILFFLLLLPFCVSAKVDIAFIVMKDRQGQILQLEPQGQFAHIAISYQGQWLHSHPYRGVEIISTESLEHMGTLRKIITISDLDSLDEALVKPLIGKAYDTEYAWNDERIYCSELVAKLLKIEPLPMSFSSPFWSDGFQKIRGELGLSPDDIYKNLKARGYRDRSPSLLCSKALNH